MLSAEQLAELVDLERGRVHASIYTRADIFERELTGIFLGTWLFLALESEVAEPGDFKTLYLGDVPLILGRGENGELIVMLNRCPSCTSTVCQVESGSAGEYRCTFHNWTFDWRGDMVEGDLSLARLTRVESYGGLVFACLSATAPDLRQHLGLARGYIDLWIDQSPTGEMALATGSWRSTYAGNWKLYMQSNGDGYRLEVLRKSGRKDEPAPAFVHPAADPRQAYDLGNGHTFLEVEAFDPAWRERYPAAYVDAISQRLGARRAERVLGAPDWRLQVFPNLCLTRNSLRVLRPVRVDETEVTQRIVELPGAPDELNRALMLRGLRLDGPAGHRSQDEFEMLERSQHGFRVAEAKDTVNAWVYLSKGLGIELTGDRGERIGTIDSEVGVRAPLRAWAALLQGQPYSTGFAG